jgi:hypothetical protein
MRTSQDVAVLDTCVLVPMPLADTLLRLAGQPAFYIPHWSSEILKELTATLLKFGYAEVQAANRINGMQTAFPEALVTGYERHLSSMKNNPKDRHVRAAAVGCDAHLIVSNNKKHIPRDVLSEFNLECVTADEFIEERFHRNPDLFITVLRR